MEDKGVGRREVGLGGGVERGQGRVRRGREGARVRQSLGGWDVQRHGGCLYGGGQGCCEEGEERGGEALGAHCDDCWGGGGEEVMVDDGWMCAWLPSTLWSSSEMGDTDTFPR